MYNLRFALFEKLNSSIMFFNLILTNNRINKSNFTMILSRDWKIILGLFLFTILVLIQGLNLHGVEYRDDEVFYYKSTQEMMHSGDILSPKYLGENRWQKPILFYW